MYPIDARVKYRDALDGPVGRLLDYLYNEFTEEWYYRIQWSDLPGIWENSAHWVHRELEVY